MSSRNSLRTTKTEISIDFLKQILEEKMEQFGFDAGERMIGMELEGVPSVIPVSFKYQKERGVKVIIHRNEK